MTLLPFLPLSAYRRLRGRVLRELTAQGLPLAEAHARFVREHPAAAAILARCNA